MKPKKKAKDRSDLAYERFRSQVNRSAYASVIAQVAQAVAARPPQPVPVPPQQPSPAAEEN